MRQRTAALIAAIIALAACARAVGIEFTQETSNINRREGPYVDHGRGFSIVIPKGWIVGENKMQDQLLLTTVRLLDNHRHEATISFKVTKYAKAVDLDSAYKELAVDAARQYDQYTEVSSGPIAVGELKGKCCIYTAMTGTLPSKFFKVIVVKDDKAAVIYCMTRPELYDSYDSVFHQIAESFQFVTEAAPKTGVSTFTSAEYRFSVTFPDDWTVGKGAVGQAVVATAPVEDAKSDLRQSVNVEVVTPNKPETLDDRVRETVALLRPVMDAEVVETATLTIDGQEARRVVYKASMGRKNIAYIVRNGALAYTVTCTCFQDKFDKYQPVFEGIVKSMKFAAEEAGSNAAAK